MSMAQGVKERSLRSLPTVLGLLGIVAAAGGLVWGGPTWLGFAGVALGGLYLLGTPVLAVVFGQIALVAVDAPSLSTLAIVEGGLFIVLLSGAVTTPHSRAAGGLVALVVPLLSGLTWLALGRWNLDSVPVGAVLLTGVAVVGYLLHRYLLLELDIVTEDPASDSDFQ